MAETSYPASTTWERGRQSLVGDGDLGRAFADSGESYVEDGLNIAPEWDTSAPRVTVTPGLVYLLHTTPIAKIQTGTNAQVDLVDANGLNYLYLGFNERDREAEIVVNDTGTAPTATSLLFATVDTSSESIAYFNQKASVELRSVSYDAATRNDPVLARYPVTDNGGESHEAGFETIQAAHDSFDEEGHLRGGQILISQEYDESEENFPITINRLGIEFKGLGGVRQIINDSGNDTFHLMTENNRPPGLTFRDISVRHRNGGSGFHIENSRHNAFINCHVNGDRNGEEPGWNLGGASDNYQNSAQVFVGCSAENMGGDGWHLGNRAHSCRFFGCAAIENGRFGVYVEGPSSTHWTNGQIEINDEVGFRARVSKNVSVTQTYFEGNSGAGTFLDSDVVFNGSDSCVVENAWFHGQDSDTHSAVRFTSGTTAGEVKNVLTNSEYNYIAQVEGGATDIDVHADKLASLSPGDLQGKVSVGNDAVRVRSNGTIVGSGSNNNGNSDMSGVDLGGVTGQFQGDEAMASGATSTAGLTARWLGSVWQPSDGSAQI